MPTLGPGCLLYRDEAASAIQATDRHNAAFDTSAGEILALGFAFSRGLDDFGVAECVRFDYMGLRGAASQGKDDCGDNDSVHVVHS